MDIHAPSSSDRVSRVHLVHQSFGDYVSGLVHGLHDIGLSVVVTTVSSGSARLTAPEIPDGVEHHQVSLPRFRHPTSPIKAAGAVRRILDVPADVVHWQAVGSPWVDLAYLAQMGRRPNVVTVHDMQPHPGDGTVLPLAFTAVHRLARRADQVTVHAPHIKTQAGAIGVDPDRVSVIAHGELATGYLPPERLPLPIADPADQTPSVLFFGRAQGYKGLDVLVEAMGLVNRHGDRVQLVVAGSGPSIDELLPPDRPTPSWCRVIRGHVARDDVAGLFGASTMVALPYREASQSGVAALAAGFGRPVVASRVPGLADIVVDGESGLLVEPSRAGELADAIVRLADDRDLAARLAAGAHRHATGALSWTNVARELHTIYDRAAGRSGGGATPGVTIPASAGATTTSSAVARIPTSFGSGQQHQDQTESMSMTTADVTHRVALIAVPGVEGGVDEAAVYLMPQGPVSDRWEAVRLVTRGGRPAAAPLVLAGAVLQLIVRRIRGRVDVLHLNISHRGSTVRKLSLAAVARVIGVPYVLQIHTGSYADFYRELPGWARAITRRLFLDSAHAFALGQVFVDLLVEEMGLAPKKVSVLRNGVPLKEPVAAAHIANAVSDDPAAAPSSTEPGARGPVESTSPVRLLFTGRIGDRKGTFDLIAALGRIPDLSWSIVIAGDGEVDRARTMAADLGIADRMEILGWQPREAVDRMVAEAEVFILPSNREALSISLLEAMAGELCCIATPVGAHGDVLVDGENSLLCQPGDIDSLEKALRLAMGDPELRLRLGEQARRKVIEECTIEANRTTLLDTYDRILG